MGLALVPPASARQVAKTKTEGQKLFDAKCAPCHGENGKGGPSFNKPLTGTRSAAELGKFVHTSMPPGRGTPLPQATKIAEYMHSAFYSAVAQERNRPARVSVARLTVKQYRNAVADLMGAFRPAVPDSPDRGLYAQYFKSRDTDKKERVIERVDPQVNFNFGTEGPEKDKFDPHNFSASWSGSIVAPDTGEYEIVVRTDHATRMWFNGEDKAFIDAWVKSGADTDHGNTVTLIGGRAYPFYFEFSKATQGVNDDDKKKGKPAGPAMVSLMWRRPKRPLETVPTRYLLPKDVPSTFVPTTPFPADDRSIGYERGNSVNKAWDDAVTAAALETAAYVEGHLERLTGVKGDTPAPERAKKLREFADWFVERAFRRPLDAETKQVYLEKQFAAAATPELALKRVVLLSLLSPRFLYREVGSDAYATAAARDGKLNTKTDVYREAERMAKDPRAAAKLRDFLLIWLKVDETPDLVKSEKRYPGFGEAVASDLRTSFELGIAEDGWNYRDLMLGKSQYLNGRLAKLYGVKLPEDAPFQKVEMDPGQRAGVLTHPYLLSRFAYLETSSPIHRGVLIARSLLGRTLAPPPQAFAPVAASLHPNLTTRERVAMQTKPAMCNSCHSMINPLGFTLERFDAIGRLRQQENGKPVNPSGGYVDRSGVQNDFKGATDLAKYLADSPEAQSAFTEKLFQHLVKQPVLAYSPKTLPTLRAKLVESKYDVRRLMVTIMGATASAEKR